MSEPTYRYGRATPRRPDDPTQRMNPIPSDKPPSRINAGRLWAGGLGTAVVVALVVVVGVLLVRGVLHIAVLAPQGEGAYGTANTTTYAISAGVLALLATALLHILLLAMPRPMQFFYWICALVTAVAVLLPFTLMANLDAQVATAGINLVAGICLMTVLGSIGASAVNSDYQR
ncbi:MAG TPA: DUF6069 family protein [Stackebrandtia sp.]|uniref:DUF6069 family protein n=1 Tax=Stackebrandtia sp. TaxID=2023065 RepID=UPI002D6E8CC2|nr:DUF6069 family protein [Stackebrandtia sp.]HZE38892.1 DUF6069 family protein [Stackebrandtia sp.]